MAERRLKLPRHWRAVAAAALVAVMWLAGPWLLRRLDFFRVRRVELIGVEYLAPHRVVAALRLGLSASVLDDLDRLERRLEALPGVAGAEVGRRLPGTLRLRLTEVVPVALVPGERGLVMVDSAGRVLPFDPARSAPSLPVLPAPDSAVAAVLARVRLTSPSLFNRIAVARRVRGDVVLEVGERRVWFTAGASTEEIRAVTAVAQDLARRGRDYAELDGRFAGQVVVRGDGA